MSDITKGRAELSTADAKNTTSKQQQQLRKVTATFKQADGTTRLIDYAPPPPPDIVTPAASTELIGYYDDDSTRRTVRELPKLLRTTAALQGPEGKQRATAHAAVTHAPAAAPPLSGKARAREEIFMRRAQLMAELNGLGMPSMVNWSTAGVKQGKVVFQPDGSNTTASTSGSAPSAGANPVLDRARKSKAQMAKITTGGRERVINGDDGGGELWSDGAAETYATRFLTVDGGGRPLVVQSMPNSRPYYPWRREEGRPANEEEAGNLAAVVRRQFAEGGPPGSRHRASRAGDPGREGCKVKPPSERDERLMKLARVLAAAYEQGIGDLGVDPKDLAKPALPPPAQLVRQPPTGVSRRQHQPRKNDDVADDRRCSSSRVSLMAEKELKANQPVSLQPPPQSPPLQQDNDHHHCRQQIQEGQVALRQDGPSGLAVTEYGNMRRREVTAATTPAALQKNDGIGEGLAPPPSSTEAQSTRGGGDPATSSSLVMPSSTEAAQSTGGDKDPAVGSRAGDGLAAVADGGASSSAGKESDASPPRGMSATKTMALSSEVGGGPGVAPAVVSTNLPQAIAAMAPPSLAAPEAAAPPPLTSAAATAVGAGVRSALDDTAHPSEPELSLFQDASDEERAWLHHAACDGSSGDESWGVASDEADDMGFPTPSKQQEQQQRAPLGSGSSRGGAPRGNPPGQSPSTAAVTGLAATDVIGVSPSGNAVAGASQEQQQLQQRDAEADPAGGATGRQKRGAAAKVGVVTSPGVGQQPAAGHKPSDGQPDGCWPDTVVPLGPAVVAADSRDAGACCSTPGGITAAVTAAVTVAAGAEAGPPGGGGTERQLGGSGEGRGGAASGGSAGSRLPPRQGGGGAAGGASGDDLYDSSGSWGIDSDEDETGAERAHADGATAGAALGGREQASGAALSGIDGLLELYGANEEKPLKLESFPDITFSEIPSWLTHPLPWFGRGGWRQSSSDIGSRGGDGDGDGGIRGRSDAGDGDDGEAAAASPPAVEVLQRQQWRDWLKAERGRGQSAAHQGGRHADRGREVGHDDHIRREEVPAQREMAPGESQEAAAEMEGETESGQWKSWRLERRARRSTGSEGGGGSMGGSGQGMPAADQHDEEWRQMQRRQPGLGRPGSDIEEPAAEVELGQDAV